MASPRRWCSIACGSLNVIFFSYDFILPREAGRGTALREQRGGRGVGFTAGLCAAPPPPCFAWFPSPAPRGRKNKIVLATRCAPEACVPPPRPGLPEGRRSAAKAQPSIWPRHTIRCRHRTMRGRGSGSYREPLAFRRSAAALARANASAVGSAPVTALPETRRNGRYPLPPVCSLPRSAGTGRCAGRAGTRSRPGPIRKMSCLHNLLSYLWYFNSPNLRVRLGIL